LKVERGSADVNEVQANEEVMPFSRGASGPRSGAVGVVSRTCGFAFTTTGQPCGHRVAPGAVRCGAGHPCPPAGTTDDRLIAAIVASDTPRAMVALRGRRPNPGRRASELLGRALAHDDAEHHGVHADAVLADPEAATELLGHPQASATARDAVVQRYGRVGALLVVGYEQRWRRTARAAGNDEVVPADAVGRQLELLLRRFFDLDAVGLCAVLWEIDVAEGRGHGGEAAAARRWLHATYSVAARDGTADAHRDYMGALDRVMRLARPLLAS